MGRTGDPAINLSRWRWRMRGATMWPSFAVCVVADWVLLRELPIQGTSTDAIDAFVLSGVINLVTVAVLAPLIGSLLRRRRGDLPRVVAADHAGTALLFAVSGLLLFGGLLNRPAVAAGQQALQAQAVAVRRYVDARAPSAYRRHMSAANTVALSSTLFRTCVPGPDPQRALCVYVDTSSSPPDVRPDSDRAPNWVYFGHRPGDFSDGP